MKSMRADVATIWTSESVCASHSYFLPTSSTPLAVMIASPQYLSGDEKSIKKFIDSFEVSKPVSL